MDLTLTHAHSNYLICMRFKYGIYTHVHLHSLYRVSSNKCRPRIRSSRTIWSSERNKRRPRIVAAATIRGTRTRMQMIPDDGHRTSARAIRVLRVVSTADSRIDRLRLLLTASTRRCQY